VTDTFFIVTVPERRIYELNCRFHTSTIPHFRRAVNHKRTRGRPRSVCPPSGSQFGDYHLCVTLWLMVNLLLYLSVLIFSSNL
jgi:hypothetical protein